MSGCAACGACCDPVILPKSPEDLQAIFGAYLQEGLPDPATDEGWAKWREWWPEEHKDEQRYIYVRQFHDARYILAKWEPLGPSSTNEGSFEYRCPMFDPESRLCTAEDDKPPICSGYPWYGKDPAERIKDQSFVPLGPQCSYWGDVPCELWPEGTAPLPVPVTIGAKT